MKTFFVPGHITGFFEVRTHEDFLKTGSRGGGIVLSEGVRTGAIVEDSEETRMKVFFHGKECTCKTTKTAVEEVLKSTCGTFDIEIHHFPGIPQCYGLGVSGSGALGTSIALNQALDLGLDFKRIGEIAHIAEVKNQTGLGDVAAELSRGLVMRTKEGAPGRGVIKSFPLEGFVVCFMVGRPLLTKTVLRSKTKKLAINAIGRLCVKEMTKDPSVERFMALSRKFTFETGLAQREVEKAIKTLEANGVTGAMAMLGNAVFVHTHDPESVKELLGYESLVVRPLDKDLRTLAAG